MLGSDDDSDDIEEEEILQVCNEFKFSHMVDHLVGFNRAIQHHKKLSKPRKHNVVLKLNEHVGFILDSYACQLLLSMRQKFQVGKLIVKLVSQYLMRLFAGRNDKVYPGTGQELHSD